MWKKTIVQVNLVIICYLTCLTVTYTLPVSSTKNGYHLDSFNRFFRPHSRFNFGLFPKRGCSGFPCMYTHLGAKAGRQELMRTLMSLIDDCAGDIACSPGKRKRRSLRNLQKRLQTTNLRDSKLAA